MRDPEASILVGKTSLPSPKTLLQHAFLAANLNFFYRVASELPNPPWGVTANLCVKNPERSGGGVYFDMRYPKTGGGEDINFCLTLKDIHMHGPNRNSPPVLGVPEAAVLHPFWGNIIGQVRSTPGDRHLNLALQLICGTCIPPSTQQRMDGTTYLLAFNRLLAGLEGMFSAWMPYQIERFMLCLTGQS